MTTIVDFIADTIVRPMIAHSRIAAEEKAKRKAKEAKKDPAPPVDCLKRAGYYDS